MNIVLVLFAVATAGAQEAAPVVDCPAPVTPAVERPVKPQRPAPPSCVNETTHRHTCSNRVIQNYEATMAAYEVSFNAYVDAVNGYGSRLAGYINAVNDYVQCEQRVVMPTSLIQG